MRDSKLAAVLALLEAWAALLLLRIAFWWSVMVIGMPLRRELMRKFVHTLEMVWLSSAELVGFETPTSENFAGRERRARRSGGDGG